MAKNYQDYCREALKRDPKTYGTCLKEDGSKKGFPKMMGFGKKMCLDMPREELKLLDKDGWKPITRKFVTCNILRKLKEIPESHITNTITKYSIIILTMPKNPTRKIYNKIWMHNNRAKKYIKQLNK